MNNKNIFYPNEVFFHFLKLLHHRVFDFRETVFENRIGVCFLVFAYFYHANCQKELVPPSCLKSFLEKRN